MSIRRAAATTFVLIALGAAACTPRHAIRIPSPPAEIRKEATIPRETSSEKAALPPLPDYGKLYAEAIDQTKKAIARAKATEALPHWKRLEDSIWRLDAIYHQGVLHHMAGELDEAANQYRRALSVSPSFEPAAANLLGIYLLRGEKQKMEALASGIFPPGSDPSPEMLPELQINLGSVLLETGRRKEAALLLLALDARKAGTPSLPWNLAVLAYRNGNRETAGCLDTKYWRGSRSGNGSSGTASIDLPLPEPFRVFGISERGSQRRGTPSPKGNNRQRCAGRVDLQSWPYPNEYGEMERGTQKFRESDYGAPVLARGVAQSRHLPGSVRREPAKSAGMLHNLCQYERLSKKGG
jgi:hypothetical protein